jgi:endo-1,4-beta-mannosidase
MRFSLGINYWPRRSAMHMWQRFDPGEIADDFARIAELGLDSVRFFLRWADFQPELRRMDRTMLARLERVMELVAASGLRAMPTLFCGHMSGVNWLPTWALDPRTPSNRFRTIVENGEVAPFGCGDFYTGRLFEAQRFHAREVGAVLRGHPAVVAWDLGNEFSNVREPAAAEDAREWSKRLTDDLERASGHQVTGGLHGEDLTLDRRIRPSSICESWPFATMHGYPVYSDFARDRTDPAVVPFLAQLIASLAAKPVLFTEFGNPTCPEERASFPSCACLNEKEMAEYATAVLDRLHADGRLGAYWWCWADYADDLRETAPFDEAEHELSFGIVRSDGTTKPVASALAAFAREAREVGEPHDPAMFEPAYYADLPRSTQDAYARFLEFHV